MEDVNCSLQNKTSSQAQIAQQQEQNNTATAMNIGRRTALKVALIGATAGVYNIISRDEAGQIWAVAKDGAVPVRGPELESASAPLLDATLSDHPVYSIPVYGSAQAAVNATPPTQTTDLRRGETLTAALILNGMTNVLGSAAGAADLGPLIAGPTLEGAAVIVRPPADNNSRDGMLLDSLSVLATNPTNTDALLIDVTGARRMHGVTVRNPYLRATNGYALYVMNEPEEADGFAASIFEGGLYDGGLRIQGGGDSLIINGGRFTGVNESIRIDLISNKLAGAGDSSQVLINGVNTSAQGGSLIERCKRPQWKNGNCEVVGGAGADNAVLSLRGAAGDPIVGGTIASSYFASATCKYGVRLGITDGVTLRDLTIGVSGADPTNACIYITADSKNTLIEGSMVLEGPLGRLIVDEGVGTMGIWKPLLNASPVANALPPQLIKRPAGTDGQVLINGVVRDVANAPEALVGRLPAGYFPVYPTPAELVAQDAGGAWTRVRVVVQLDGSIVVAARVPDTNVQFAQIFLAGLSFPSSRV